ncbi:hypothetical protein BST61_g4406 [Cercospora zeina]
MASMLTTRLPEAEAVLGLIHNSTSAIKDFGTHLVEGQNGTLVALDGSTIMNWLIVSTVIFKFLDWTYNLLLHPCRKIPGPFFCRMTILPNLYHNWKGDKHLVVEALHEQYGEIVRIEPNFISIMSPNSVQSIYGTGSQWGKGYYISIGVPGWAMHRNEKVFPEPRVFRPDRWMTDNDDEIKKLRSAHLPFSYGPRACVGRNLALATIHITVARLAFLFEMESRDELPLEFQVKDHFAAGNKNGPFLKWVPRDTL